MAEPARVPPEMTEDDYLAFEESSATRNEFVGGYVFAQAGGSASHARLAFTFGMRIELAAGGSGCRVFTSDFRLRLDARHSYYPDLMVVCEPVDPDARSTSSPCVIVEVLSPSTARTDRGEKLQLYTTLPSLRAYLILDPVEPRGELHYRTDDGRWHRTDLGPDDDLRLPCPPGFRLPLAVLYSARP